MSSPEGVWSAEQAEAASARLSQLEAILRLAPVGIGLVDAEGRTTMTNGALHRMLGYTPEEFATLSWSDYTHPDDIATNAEYSRRLAAGEIDRFEMEKRFRRKDGRWVWTSLTVSLVHQPDGSPAYEIGMITDITRRKQLEIDLRAAEERYRVLVERVPAVVYSAEPGATGRWRYVSPQIERMLGFTAEEWMDDPGLWWRQVDPGSRAAVLATERQMVADGVTGEQRSDTYRMMRKDGTLLWVRDDGILQYDAAGEATIQGVLVDVTQEKDLEERLGHHAYHDALTALPNRDLFRDRVDEALAATGADGRGTAVLFIDLDNFKTVNDTFGHAAGDAVIISAADVIRACARRGDLAARWGGDEFALLLRDATEADAVALADRIIAELSGAPVTLSGRSVRVGASVGIAMAATGEGADTVLRNADLAMYHAKARGRDRHATYEPTMYEGAVAQFRLDEALTAAVAAGEIAPIYQPIVNLRTGEVVGIEALARWTDPVLGPVPPADFIGVAEQAGLIGELGAQIMRRACADVARWRRSSGSAAFVTVNVSPLQLERSGFHAEVMGALHDAGLDPAALTLEVTEGLLLEEHSRATLQALRAQGVRVAIDDFGTGYSSLGYLRELPVDMIKLDQAFLTPAGASGSDRAFLQAVLDLVQTVGLVTIAEGIETDGQLAELRATSCEYGQGYLAARPGPIDRIPAHLAAFAADA